jgi:hypothetical protein
MADARRRLPDFLIAGAPRSGTTWLYHLLERHTEVYMARPVVPEPKFFLVDELYERGLDWYSNTWFADAPPDRKAGEKSTNYLESAFAAERIHRDLPDVRLVFILRNPVDRAYSNYQWTKRNGLETEDFATALRLEASRESSVPRELRYARPHAYFSRGVYADLLRPYLERFGESVLCLRFEDVLRAPTGVAARLHRFLGIAPRPEDARDLGVVNESDPHAEPMAPAVRRELQARYEEPNRRLQALLRLDAPLWPNQPATHPCHCP